MARRPHTSDSSVRSGGHGEPARPHPPRRAIAAWAALLVLCGLVAYHGTWGYPFQFDDIPAITENPTIRQLWPPWQALRPPSSRGITVEGRPLLNLSFAASYAISGDAPWAHRAGNVVIHLAAGLVLFGLVRRTLRRLPDAWPGAGPRAARLASYAPWIAGSVAGLWILHPLQTESVTYIVQRAESLVGLFYLLTCYTFVRAAEASGRSRTAWAWACVIACTAGMASKEVMASAPVLVLLYDRTFIAGTFAAAWRDRRRLYLALASTWILLAVLILQEKGRGGTVGFGTPLSTWDYITTQAWAIVHYLRLAFWPSPLVIDYGYKLITAPSLWIPCGLGVLALLAATVAGVIRRSPLAFAGAWFFAILAPTSSFIPVITQPIAEHRMYLPLAAVIVLVVVAAFAWLGRAALALVAAAAIALGITTTLRNHDYRTTEALWRDTLEKEPANARAHRSLGLILYHAGELQAALGSLETALSLDPGSSEVHNYLANVLLSLGRVREAGQHAAEAVRISPEYGDAHNNYGVVLARLRRPEEAAQHFSRAAELMPRSASPRLNLANTRLDLGRPAEALPWLDEAVTLEPGLAEAHLARGNALLRLGRVSEATDAFERAVALKPTMGEAQFALGNVLIDLGRLSDAIAHLREAVRLAPRSIPAMNNLADALIRAGRTAEAAQILEQALALDPTNPYVRENLARVRGAR